MRADALVFLSEPKIGIILPGEAVVGNAYSLVSQTVEVIVRDSVLKINKHVELPTVGILDMHPVGVPAEYLQHLLHGGSRLLNLRD